MSKLNIKIPHQLPQQEAVSRIKKLLSNLQREQKDMIKDISEDWKGNEASFSFTAKGFDISGHLQVEPNEVIVNGELPFMLSFFKGPIEQVIKEKAAQLLV